MVNEPVKTPAPQAKIVCLTMAIGLPCPSGSDVYIQGMKTTSTKQVIKAIGNEHLSLYRGNGYWYFIYDDIKATGRYDSLSVLTMRLGDLSLERWVEEGRELVAKMESK
jgi:hypothetical protein